ncbi:MAG: bifunctional phosphoribosylaminoimidazolecarboxamide formyltransferase/IMP cyclohydrolase [Candidatus Micrarchaeota archaeon]
MVKVNCALISASNKDGIVEFAKGLSELGVKIISSGGTAELLSKNKVPVVEISKVTGFPEMMDGRVKTLHPKIHGGILADRSKKSHLEQAKKQGIELIDLVIVNLYPFEQTIRKGVSIEEAIENIDIGGPTLVRSAAKNFKSVGVVCDSANYGIILKELKENKCSLSEQTRKDLALDAFSHVAHYDAVIELYLRKAFGKTDYPHYLNLTFEKSQDMRYGENPHQSASFYFEFDRQAPSVSSSKCLQGRELSYNNILDINSAFELVKEFKDPTVVIVKHNNPCGVASDPDLISAYKKALAVDTDAAFGGVISINKKMDEKLAALIIERFYEVVVAPGFTDKAKEIFTKKSKLRLIEMGEFKTPKTAPQKTYRSVVGGLLVQDLDNELLDESKLRAVTKRKPTDQEMKDLIYAWTICKHVKSNSIVYARNNQAVGIGAGQMKRIDAAKLAAMIAESYGETVKGCAMASDAFFPFRDGVDAAAKVGVTCVIQPGGSIKDPEVINAANEHNLAMVFTGMRHFRH